MTGVDVEMPSGQRLHFVWVPEVNSTQDGMRQLLAEGAAPAADVVALGAGAQMKGRGTSGREWVGLQGNVFLTLALPTAPKEGDGAEPLLPFPITLLPLRIGTLVARGGWTDGAEGCSSLSCVERSFIDVLLIFWENLEPVQLDPDECVLKALVIQSEALRAFTIYEFKRDAGFYMQMLLMRNGPFNPAIPLSTSPPTFPTSSTSTHTQQR